MRPQEISRAVEKFVAAIPAKAPAASHASDAELTDLPHIITWWTDLPHIIALWHSEPKYVDGKGDPRRLTLRGPAPSFEALVRRVNRSIDVQEAMAHLIRTQTVRKAAGHYVPRRRWVAFRRAPGPLQLHNFRGVAEMLRTVEHNLVQGGWFQRIAENKWVPESQVAAVEQFLEREAMGFLSRVDRFLQLCQGTRRPSERTVWLGTGVYRFQREEAGRVSTWAESANPRRSRSRRR
jgi:hypothetical protein